MANFRGLLHVEYIDDRLTFFQWHGKFKLLAELDHL